MQDIILRSIFNSCRWIVLLVLLITGYFLQPAYMYKCARKNAVDIHLLLSWKFRRFTLDWQR